MKFISGAVFSNPLLWYTTGNNIIAGQDAFIANLNGKCRTIALIGDYLGDIYDGKAEAG